MTTETPAKPGRRSTPSRYSPKWVAGAGAVLLLVGLGSIVRHATEPAPKPPGEQVGEQLDTALPANIENLPLVDEYGKATSLAAFKGKVVVLTDFMTLCQEICPITTAELNDADQAVQKAGLGDKVQFVEITIDPSRDTPARLHAYRTFAALHANFSLLTGTQANLNVLWKHLGVGVTRQAEDNPPAIDWWTHKPLTYDLGHNDVLMYLDAAGHERYVIEGMPNGSTAKLTAGETSFLSDEGRENLTDTSDASWTEAQALQVVSWLTDKHLKLPA